MPDRRDHYLCLIRQHQPELTISSAREHRGQFNDVLIINDEFVFRFPRESGSASSLAREIAVLQTVRRHVGLQVPDPSLTLLDDTTREPICMGYRMISGQPFRPEYLTEIGDRAMFDDIARQLGTFLRALHGIPVSEIPHDAGTGETPEAWASFYEGVRQDLFPYMREDARCAFEQHFAHYFANPETYRYSPAIRHGDFGAGNIMFDRESGSITGVIDFEFARSGDPAQDIGGLLICYGIDVVERMCSVYPEIEHMIERARFDTGTYALQQALSGLRSGERETFEEGISAYR